MKWAIYWEKDNEINCEFRKTEEEARARVAELIAACDEASQDGEAIQTWETTLLQVRGEVHNTPDGLILREVR